MKITSISFLSRAVWIHRAVSPEEVKQLKTLVSETRMICTIAQSTGMYIVDELEEGGAYCVVIVMKKELKVTETDIQALRTLIRNL